MNPNQDPVLDALAEISRKQDTVIAKQDKLETQINQIHADCRRVARTNGAVAGGVSGGIVSLGILLIKAKFGL